MATILMISYDSKLLETRDSILRSLGHETMAASNKAEGLQRLHEDRYDLVVVCYSIPEAEQNQLIRELRKQNDTPVLLLRSGAVGGTPKDAQTTAIQYSPSRFVEAVGTLTQWPR